MGSIFKNGRYLWGQYYRNGQKFRESSKSTRREDAVRLLKLREGEIAKGLFPGLEAERLSFEDLAKLLIRDYEVNGKKSLGRGKQSLAPLIDSSVVGRP